MLRVGLVMKKTESEGVENPIVETKRGETREGRATEGALPMNIDPKGGAQEKEESRPKAIGTISVERVVRESANARKASSKTTQRVGKVRR